MSSRKKITYSSHPNHAARAAHKAGERLFRTYDTSHIRPKKNRVSVIVTVVIVVVMACLLCWGGYTALSSCSLFNSDDSAALADGQTIEVTIPEGSSAASIAQLLEDSGVISSASAFQRLVSSSGMASSLLPGTYSFTGPTTLTEIMNLLVAGPNVSEPALTIPEGLTVDQIAALVAEAYEGSIAEEDFLAAVNSASDYEEDYPFVADVYNNSLEGFLFPKTYEILDNATADDVVRQMLDQYQTEIASIDFSYAESQGLSQYEVLIIASLIEREATLDEDRALISSVIYNRLAIGMALQIDSTVVYVTGSSEITMSDLQVDSPYNSYLYAGLIPGPICSPGLASIQAAAQPEETSYLYYVLSSAGDGSHSFSETYEEHLAKVEELSES